MSRSVRLKEHLAAEVERLANEERRSLSQMVELLLEQALAWEPSEVPKVREAPATDEPRVGIEVPPDGTLSPPISVDFGAERLGTGTWPEREVKPDPKGGAKK